MTKFILIRHGKPDYKILDNTVLKGHGYDLAFLSQEGIDQAKKASENYLLKNAEILISSPYTRCMQTSSIISNQIKLPIIGEVNLHEWLPDLNYNYQSKDLFLYNFDRAINDYLNNQITSLEYESINRVRIRVLNVLKKYLEYQKVIVVTHGGVMFSLTNKFYSYCQIEEINYDGKILKK